MGTRDVSQCFECGVVGEGEVDIDDGLFYCYACWLIYHAARARLRRDTTHVQPARNFQGVSSAGRTNEWHGEVRLGGALGAGAAGAGGCAWPR